MSRLRELATRIRNKIAFHRRVIAHPGTPWPARILLGAAIVYALSPIDIIPDWIPVLGYLDDVVIVPLLVMIALALVPKSVIQECRYSR